jgi:hypothetical protein
VDGAILVRGLSAAGLDCDGGGEGEPLVVGVDGAILVRGLSAAGLDDGGGGGDDIED